MDSHSLPEIRVTEVGEFIRHNSCERRFKLAFDNRKEAKELPFSERLFNTLDPVLQQVGKDREDEWERSLKDEAGLMSLNIKVGSNSQLEWNEFKDSLKFLDLSSNAYA